MSSWQLPEVGVVCWPVGNGDATTIVVDPKTILQVDINHRGAADGDDDEKAQDEGRADHQREGQPVGGRVEEEPQAEGQV